MNTRQTRTEAFPVLSGDLRRKNREMCQLWGCEKYTGEGPCAYCPVVADIDALVRRNKMVVDEWEYECQAAPVFLR
jgi:hypothetical protein